MINHQLDALNAALQIAGQRLLEADHAFKAASQVSRDAHAHYLNCYRDAETLLKVIRDLSGGSGKQSVPVGIPEITRIGRMHRVVVRVSGRKGSLKRAEAVRQRLCGGAAAAMPAGD